MKAIKVHTFIVTDIPYVSREVNERVRKWTTTEPGQFATTHTKRPLVCAREATFTENSYIYNVIAHFDDDMATYWILKYT